MLKRFRSLCAVGLAGLVGCGGGGGGSEELKLRFTSQAVAKTYYEWDFPLGEQPPIAFNVQLRVTGGTSASTVYVSLVDLGSWLTPGTEFQEVDLDLYEVGLALPREYEGGMHTGTLEAKLCSDPACNNVLTSDTLGYTVTERANPAMTVTSSAALDGKALVNAGGANPASAFTLPEFTLVATQVPTEFRSFFYVRVDDPDNRIKLVSGPSAANHYYFDAFPAGGRLALDFTLVKPLPAGEHTGTLSLRVCRDEYCLRPYTGSASLPYQISVASSDLAPFAPAEGVSEWYQPLGGNSAHNAHVPMTVDVAALSPRWHYQLGAGEYNFVAELVTFGGRVFTRTPSQMQAFNEADGTLAWTKNLGYSAPLLAANDAIYVRSSYPGSPTLLYKLDPATGSDLFAVEQDVDGAGAPLSLVNGNVLAADWVYTGSQPNYYEEFNLYDGQTGATLDVPPCLRDLEAGQKTVDGFLRVSRGPAIQGTTAYLFSTAGLEVVDFGEAQSCTTRAYWDMTRSAMPVLAPNGYLLEQTCTSSSSTEVLHGIPATGSAWPWSAPSACIRPVAAAGIVYTSKAWGEGLQAVNAGTGAPLWTLLDPRVGMYGGTVLATDNVLFVSGVRTYAIDPATRRLLWSMSPAGTMALSPGGVLYLLNGTSIFAVNVRQ